MSLDRQTKRALNALREQVETAFRPVEAAPAVLIEGPALATAEDVARLEAKLDSIAGKLDSLLEVRTARR